MLKLMKQCVGLGLILLLSGCIRDGLAPVVESRWHRQQEAARYVVVRGDTLYSIAFRYDMDYELLARNNGLTSPYTLFVGQVLLLKATARAVTFKKPVVHHETPYQQPQKVLPKVWPKVWPKVSPKVSPKISSRPHLIEKFPRHKGPWLWPAEGQIYSSFSPNQGRKGIDIHGKKGTSVRAASAGVVAYAGNGLEGYGNLIIIKHNPQFLTAYGNNSHNLVRVGQNVKAGQVIAEMGIVDRKYWGLHFEMRKWGQPVNPLHYMKKRG
jgi:lipoprotein NlpD